MDIFNPDANPSVPPQIPELQIWKDLLAQRYPAAILPQVHRGGHRDPLRAEIFHRGAKKPQILPPSVTPPPPDEKAPAMQKERRRSPEKTDQTFVGQTEPHTLILFTREPGTVSDSLTPGFNLHAL